MSVINDIYVRAYCALRAHVRCKRLTDTLLHYIRRTCHTRITSGEDSVLTRKERRQVRKDIGYRPLQTPRYKLK